MPARRMCTCHLLNHLLFIYLTRSLLAPTTTDMKSVSQDSVDIHKQQFVTWTILYSQQHQLLEWVEAVGTESSSQSGCNIRISVIIEIKMKIMIWFKSRHTFLPPESSQDSQSISNQCQWWTIELLFSQIKTIIIIITYFYACIDLLIYICIKPEISCIVIVKNLLFMNRKMEIR